MHSGVSLESEAALVFVGLSSSATFAKTRRMEGSGAPCAGLQAQFLNTGQINWANHPCAQWAKLITLLSSWGQREGLTEDKAPWVTLQRGVLQEDGAGFTDCSPIHFLFHLPGFLQFSWI